MTQSQRTRLDLLVHLPQGYGNNRCGRHVTKIVQHLTNFDVFLWGFSENFERKLRINYIALLNLFFYLTIFKQVSQYLQRLFLSIPFRLQKETEIFQCSNPFIVIFYCLLLMNISDPVSVPEIPLSKPKKATLSSDIFYHFRGLWPGFHIS